MDSSPQSSAPDRFWHRRFILKADDFGRGPLVDNWRRFADVCFDFQIIPSIGIVGRDFSQNNAAQALAKYLSTALKVEFWNHSFSHQDVRRMTPADRATDTTSAQQVIKDVLEYAPDIYGAPFNAIDEASIRDIDSAGQFFGYYFADALNRPERNIPIRFMMTPEVGTQMLHPVSFKFFKTIFDRRDFAAAAILQVHPAYWSRPCFEEFRQTLRYLRQANYQPLNAKEYLEYQIASQKTEVEQITVGTATFIAESLYNDSKSDPDLDKMNSADRAYYFDRFKHGTARLTNFLSTIGFFNNTGRGAAGAFLDIGAGVGNWCLAAVSAGPEVRAIAVDRNAAFSKFIEKRLAALAPGNKISFLDADAEKLPIANAAITNFVCNNALNYMKADRVLAEAARVLESNGLGYIGVQNELHPILDLLRCLSSGDREGALNRIDRLMETALRRAGYPGGHYFINYWTDSELVAMAVLSGFQPLMRGINPPEEYGSLFGLPALWGYLFIRTEASAARAEQLRSGKCDEKAFSLIVRAGATALCRDILRGNKQLWSSPTVSIWLVQLCREKSQSLDAVLKELEADGITLGPDVISGAEARLKFLESGEGNGTATEEMPAALLAMAWRAARKAGRQPNSKASDSGGLCHVVYQLGLAIMQGDRDQAASSVTRLFEWAAQTNNLALFLSGEGQLPPELLCAPDSSSLASLEDERKFWVKTITEAWQRKAEAPAI